MLKKIYPLIIIFLIIINLNCIFCQNLSNFCSNNLHFDNTKCFNNIIIFNQKKYQANNFAKNKNGDLILELTELSENDEISSSRLLYGLKNEGEFMFSNKPSYAYEFHIDNNEEIINEYNSVYLNRTCNSINLFVSLRNDINKENQYLFSINPYKSMVELYNLNKDNNSYYIWSFNNFFRLNKDDYSFQYEYLLIELRNESTYIISFIPKVIISENIKYVTFIKKFELKSFDINAYEELNTIDFSNYLNHQIIDVFFMDDIDIVCIVSYYIYTIEEVEIEDEEIKTLHRALNYLYTYYNFVLNFYDSNLQVLPGGKDKQFYNVESYNFNKEEFFFKSVYLNNQNVFLLFRISPYCFKFKSLNINNMDISSYEYESFCPYIYVFKTDESLNNIVKIDNKRIVFIYTSYINVKLCIIIIDNIQIGISLNINEYYIDLDNISLKNQISGYIYNNYLIFATTSILKDEDNNLIDNNYFSIFMIFGYANGTDRIVDISEFLNDNENYNPDKSFFNFLNDELIIENNIFGYEPDNKIKLISISPEILFFQMDNSELIQLDNNSLIYYDKNYVMKQNKISRKSSKYYNLEYQYIVKEPNHDSVANDDEQRIYYGRVNQLQFKLCHKYCETCYDLGIYDNNQKCLSCLPVYQYDYWYYFNNTKTTNCVPEGYYFDIEKNSLILCNSTEYKYYFNTTDNKTICFNDDYNCPSSYPYLNEITKECSSFKNESNNEYLQCNYDNYIKELCSFDNYNTSEEIYEIIKNNFVSNYISDKGYLRIVDTKDKYIFQITSVKNELKALETNFKSNLSIIDMKECADLLKSQNGLDSNDDLVILKYENENSISNGNEKSVQYEVYLPNSNIKLNLSICSNTKINIYVPVKLNEKTQKLYEDLKEQGYDLFDKNNKFYKDICTPYKSENGTDVILADRFNDFFSANQLTCQANCEYSDYLYDSQYIKCKCDTIDEEKIETNEPEKITKKTIGKSFYDTLKYSNYKVLMCYKLVFRKVTFYKNFGSIISLIYFSGYFIGFLLFSYRKLYYIKYEIGKLFNKEINNNENKDDIK